MSWDRLTVDALVEAVSTTSTGRARTGMVVHIDLPTLTGGRHDTTLCETPDRVATWTRPDGHTYWTGTLNDRHPIAA